MKILIACEESQRVCIAFRNKGHEAYSCDLQECSGGHPEWHICGDVLNLLDGDCIFWTDDDEFHAINGSWDMIIAHPPCTFMSKAGARWMYPKAGIIDPGRLMKAHQAASLFYKIYNCNCKKIAIENPVPLKVVGLPSYDQKIQPYEYGEKYSKATCLWLKGLPALKPTQVVEVYEPFCPSNTSAFSKGAKGSPGAAHTQKYRSKTFIGIAQAMADQWSK